MFNYDSDKDELETNMFYTLFSVFSKCVHFIVIVSSDHFPCVTLQWGAVEAEIKVPSGENTELKRSPFIAWSRSVYRLSLIHI